MEKGEADREAIHKTQSAFNLQMDGLAFFS
jgi:hypothetical protein